VQEIELVRVLVFVALVAAVYLAAAAIVVDRLRRRPAPPPRKRRVQRAILGAAAAGTLCVAWGILVEPRWLEVTRPRVQVRDRLARPIRIAHVSDLHCNAAARLEPTLVARVAEEKPDLVCFTGDSANSPEGVPLLKETLAGFARVAPTFVVRGNWDLVRDLDLYSGTGVRELDGEVVRVDVAGTPVFVGGAAARNKPGVDRAVAAFPRDGVNVFLHHYPDEIEEVAARGGVDLYLAGHTHGGQVALPFYGALITFSRFGKKYESGQFLVGETTLYVSRGIGMDGRGAPPVRFCARPELAIVEVVGGVGR
jgi:predicted MPP superfamily phosphohydrolase